MRKNWSAPRALGALLGAALTVGTAGAQTVPERVRDFSERLPALHAALENLVAREEITQEELEHGRIVKRRVLICDYQVAHLENDPKALWEFRFVREVDGRKLADFDRRISDFFLLRFPDAAHERLSLARLPVEYSLPGCYWHNLTLALDAFAPDLLHEFEFMGEGDHVVFRQTDGPGIPEDFFDPSSPRHRPEGTMDFVPEGWLSRLVLTFPSGNGRVRIELSFSAPAPPENVILPREYVVTRIRCSDEAAVNRTIYRYTDYRRFSVETEEETKKDKT
jgi:hypothetical protein